jgi:hypothetical protein
MTRWRGFTTAELAAVLVIVGVVGGVAVQVLGSGRNNETHGLERERILEFFRHERRIFVNRGAVDEVLLFCPFDGARGPCDSPVGPTVASPARGLVAYRVQLPVNFPIARDREQARIEFTGEGAFDVFGSPGPSPTQWSMMIDAWSRVLPADGLNTDASVLEADAVNRSFTLTHGSTNSTIFFRNDGLVVTTWGQGYGEVVSPRLRNVGSRATPNATPLAVPTGAMPARRVRLE